MCISVRGYNDFVRLKGSFARLAFDCGLRGVFFRVCVGAFTHLFFTGTFLIKTAAPDVINKRNFDFS